VTGLLEALDDRSLLGATFRPFPRQREMLAAFERHERIVIACGRRSGKSSMLAAAGLHNVTMRPDLDAKMRQGERRYSVIVATRLPQARLVLDMARAMVRASPMLSGLVERDTENAIEFRLPGGARSAFAAFPCGSRGGRGWPISFLGLDELAHFIDSEGNSAAESIWQALAPSVAQFGHLGRIVASSTPAGAGGLFAELFQRAQSGEDRRTAAFQFPSDKVNTLLSGAWLAAERERDPDLYESEFEARFVGGVGAFFDTDRVTCGDFREIAPDAGTGWVMGVDVALQRDPFAVVVVGRDATDRRRLLVGHVDAWWPGGAKSFEDAERVREDLFGRAVAVAKRYGARAVVDQYAHERVKAAFREAGLVVSDRGAWTAASKWERFGHLRSLLYTGELTLPDDPDLLAELRQVRVAHAGAGSKIVTPRSPRGHCDRVHALAAAAYELRRPTAVRKWKQRGTRGIAYGGGSDAAVEPVGGLVAGDL
jgi:hypothetical protein